MKSKNILREELLTRIALKPRSLGTIAKEAGVSKPTITRFLMNSGDVSFETWMILEKYLLKLQQEEHSEI